MQNEFIRQATELVDKFQQAGAFVVLAVLVFTAILAIILIIVNSHHRNKNNASLEKLRLDHEQSMDKARADMEMRRQEIELEIRQHGLERERTEASTTNRIIDLTSEKMDTTINRLMSQQTDTLQTLMDRNSKAMEILTTTHVEESAQIISKLSGEMRVITAQFVNSMDKHNTDALARYDTIIASNAQSASRQETMLRLLTTSEERQERMLKMFESNGDCEKDKIVELNHGLELLRELIMSIRRDDPDPKPPKVTPLKPAKEVDESDSEEQAA